jgi:putative ABC transport system permease protein
MKSLEARHWVETFSQDVRYGARQIGRSRLHAVTVVLTLALGIGLNTGIFSVLNGMLFRPRVSKDPATFVHLATEVIDKSEVSAPDWPFSAADYHAYRAGAQSVSNLAAWAPAHANIDNGSESALLMLVSCNFFSLYGLEQPTAGRLFRDEECAAPGSAPVVILSEELWRGRFGSDPHILGATIKLRRQPFTVVGIVPGRFPGRLRGRGIWIPYTMQASVFNQDWFGNSEARWLTIEGRLQPGQTRESAHAELSVIASQLDRQHPGRKTTMFVTNGSMIDEPFLRSKLVWLGPLIMGLVTLVLLLACTNVTMLSLARASARRQEIAVRLSLGAGRARLTRMLLTESLMLATAAGAISIWMAYRVPQFFEHQAEPVWNLRPDWTVFAYLAGITILAACIAGLTPAAESLRVDLAASVKEEDGLSVGRSVRGGVRNVLVGAQVAMSLVLLTGAGLFLNAQLTIFSDDPGFETRQVLVVALDARKPAAFYQQVTQGIRALPGVEALSPGEPPPMFGNEGNVVTEEMRSPGQAKGSGVRASTMIVGSAYFDTLRIGIVRGRSFREGERSAVVVSAALARALWPDQDPLGHTLQSSNGELLDIVGVARNTKSERFGEWDGPRVYRLPTAGRPPDVLLIRFAGDAGSIEEGVRSLIHSLDRELLPTPRTLDAMRQEMALTFWRLARLVLFLGAVGLLLAVIGIYGVVAFTVSRRKREIGIRIALGATRGVVVRTVLGPGMRPVLAGLAVGTVLTIAGVYGLAQVLRETPLAVSTLDPLVYLAVSVILIGSAAAAMVGPAWRATRADPVVALRHT